MIKKLVILFLTIVISSCATQDVIQTPSDSKLVKDIDAFMTSWHQAASDSDFENYFKKMDSESMFMGTDSSENWAKQQFEDYSKPYFDKGETWNFKTLERNIYSNESKSMIWFDELLDTWMGVCRGSGVIELENAEFKIKQYVLSLTIPNEDIQRVIDAKRINDNRILEQLKSRLKS